MGNCFPGSGADNSNLRQRIMDNGNGNPSPGGTNRGIDNDERVVQAQGRALDAIASAILTESAAVPTTEGGTKDKIHIVRHGEAGIEIAAGKDGLTTVFAYVREGMRKRCQDAVVVCTNAGGVDGQLLVVVCDGHGPFGHHTSNMVRDTLPLRLSEFLTSHAKDTCQACGAARPPHRLPRKEKLSCEGAAVEDAYAAVERHCMMAAEGARTQSPVLSIGMDCSGTTCVSVLLTPGRLVVAGCGDSRVVLGTSDGRKAPTATVVSRDHKPLVGEERRRCEAAGARVFAHANEVHIPRVWLPDADAPGLAMTRAFGDACLKRFGLTAEPDVFERPTAAADDYLVLATDGIWDVVSNLDAVKVVRDAVSKGANPCESLVEHCYAMWKQKYPTSVVDDMGVIVVKLGGLLLSG